MASYQPPNEQTAIFNSQNFTTSYSGQHDPTKMNYPVAQGTPVVPSLLVTSGGNSQTITSTGIGNVLTAQIPQLNTANAFTANQTLSGSANVIGASTIGTTGYSNTFIGNSSIFQHNIALSNSVINLIGRNYLGYYLPITPTAITGSSFTGTGTTTLTLGTSNAGITVGSAILGTGVTANTYVTAVVTTGLVFTLNQNVAGTPSIYVPNAVTGFSLATIYYVTPSTTTYNITLPAITSSNIGATTTFRVVNTNATTGANVTISPTSPNLIYEGTTSTGVSSHTIYTGNSTTILSHTFMALPTSLGGTYGWFQLGTV